MAEKVSVKLAEALLRRKELAGKVQVLSIIKEKGLFEVKVRRAKVTDSVDEIVAEVPKLTASQVTAEYDFYARQLRAIDSAIQQVNWSAMVELDSVVMGDYQQPK